ncbi:MAG: futalosine hydrolase [Jatrophihabitans sp.]
MSRVLVVTAVAAEGAAVLGGRAASQHRLAGLTVHRASIPAGQLDVLVGGVGAVAAGLSTATLLSTADRPDGDYDLVIAAGIAGGYPGAGIGQLVLADALVHADLGAETADGSFSSLAELGWGPVRWPVRAEVVAELSKRAPALTGAVLSVSTVTGTQARADRLLASHPDAVAEAMEGAGICQAADRAGLRFAEVRTISNRVGPRDRDGWRIDEALAALSTAFDRLLAEPLHLPPRSEPSR